MKTKTCSVFVLCCWLASVQLLPAQTPNWASDVAPILFDHCVQCHHPGGVGNFSLTDYASADNNAQAILDAVETGYMPPWRPQPGYNHFRDENFLTAAEIQAIHDWVNGGTPAGNPNDAPPVPSWDNGPAIANPDLTLETPQYVLNTWQDEYRAFAIPVNLATDKFFNQIDIIPGNTAIIHHIVLYTDPTDAPHQLDLADPGPGFATSGMVGNITPQSTLVGEWTPGGTPLKLPPQFGLRIPASGYFIFEIHFAPGHFGQVDPGSRIDIQFSPNYQREVYYGALLAADSTYGLLNPPFKIPANQKRTLLTETKVSELSGGPALTLFSLTPHAHVVCSSFKSFMYKTGTTDTVPLINVPKWDFSWQSTYTLKKAMKLPGNYRIRGEVTYDNTTDNPLNPNDPPQDVWWGEKTSDEMLYLFCTVALYQPGDENIVLDSTLLTPVSEPVAADGLFAVQPNPASDYLTVTSDASGPAELDLFDACGRRVRAQQVHDLREARLPVYDLPKGVYVLKIRQGAASGALKVLVE